MSPWWAVPLWALLGAIVGATLRQPSQGLLALPRQAHPLIAAMTVASATAVLFGGLAWRVGVHPELVAYSGPAAVCVPLASIDLLEQRMPARLLLPAYPTLAVLLALALGWQSWNALIGGTLLGLLYAALTSATMILLQQASRHTLIPFGPALIAGAFTALLIPIG
ncbi:MAG: hypothetical protein ACRDRE_19510 [Pseudonocardiaceae bacterium]